MLFTVLFVIALSACQSPVVAPEPIPATNPVELSEEALPVPVVPAEEPAVAHKQWTVGELVIPGNYADADVVQLEDGTYRIYYGIEPEVPGNNLEVYSATSFDGKVWKQEAGTRRTQSVFPDVVKISDGWRMYLQNNRVIKSAHSNDGLQWTDESGTRIDSRNSVGLTFDRVAAPTTLRLNDGSYLMVYSGSINEEYTVCGAKVPNKDSRALMWATSADGLSWTIKGIALDARNPMLEGFADGPELVQWDNEIRLYFWGYQGVYYSVFDDSRFSEPVLVIAPSNPKGFLYPYDPPGDPTLIKIGDIWHMYYGVWKKGIFVVTEV